MARGRPPPRGLVLHARVLRPRHVDARRPRGGGRERGCARDTRRRRAGAGELETRNRDVRFAPPRAPETVAGGVVRDGAPRAPRGATAGGVDEIGGRYRRSRETVDGGGFRRRERRVGASARRAFPRRALRRRGDETAKRRFAFTPREERGAGKRPNPRLYDRDVRRAVRRGHRSARVRQRDGPRVASMRRTRRGVRRVAVLRRETQVLAGGWQLVLREKLRLDHQG